MKTNFASLAAGMVLSGLLMGAWTARTEAPPQAELPRILSWSPHPATPEQSVHLIGRGFGSVLGRVVVSGLRISADQWTDEAIRFRVPAEAASGALVVYTAEGRRSPPVSLTVQRSLPAGQRAPYGFTLADTGLLGAAFLVETDGAYLYAVSGLETLTTYRLAANRPPVCRSRQYLNQRIGDVRVVGGYLFCAGDHGLSVFRRADLQTGPAQPVAALAGFSALSVDARPDPTGRIEGWVVALAEYAPRGDTGRLRVFCYQFADETLRPLGVYRRAALAGERQYAVALDPQRRKAYVSGATSLLGTNQYILELNLEDLSAPELAHREPTPKHLAFDMEARGSVLWTGLVGGGTALFRVYDLHPGADHLRLRRTVAGRWSPGRATRLKILNDEVTVGCAWFGQRPDIFLFDTFGRGSRPLAQANSLDWAFDIAGAGTADRGRIFVADEWGGFLTWRYDRTATPRLSHAADYQWAMAASMTEGLQLAEDRIYIAGRGAGPWSADRFDLANESQWRHVAFEWSQPAPQPHPVSALAVRRDPEAGMLIAALGHEKAMAWGHQIVGLLYRETSTAIELLAASAAIDPPGLWSSGVSVVWPRPDLVFMTTGSDGFRAYVIDPRVPSIQLHSQCRATGFDPGTFHTGHLTTDMNYWTAGADDLLVVGSRLNGWSNTPTLNFYTLSYPQGPPDRHQPRAPIQWRKSASLNCLKFKSVNHLDVRPAGWIALATSQGLALLHRQWIPRLNALPDGEAWRRIHVPTSALAPWWDDSWSAEFKDVCFADERTLYAVQNPHGVWRIHFASEPADLAVRCLATAYYPGVECGLDYTRLLQGWADPDVPTLHNPYALATDGESVYVTGWSGKARRLDPDPRAGVRILQAFRHGNEMALLFSSPFGPRNYTIERRDSLANDVRWTVVEPVSVQGAGPGRFRARFPAAAVARQFYRLRIQP